jgi:hypothetical protein
MSFHRLRAGGCLVLNVADIKGKDGVVELVSNTIDVATQAGFILEATLTMPLSSLRRKDPTEPVLVFRKPI